MVRGNKQIFPVLKISSLHRRFQFVKLTIASAHLSLLGTENFQHDFAFDHLDGLSDDFNIEWQR